MKFLYKTQKKQILNKLSYYGITKLPFLLIPSGKEKIRGYSGNLSMDEISKIKNLSNIEAIGLYLFHDYGTEIRLSLDAIHLLKDQITKNILELTEEQAELWFKGIDIPITEKWKQEERGFKVLKLEEDFIGCGKLSEDRLINYMPKERRIKT